MDNKGSFGLNDEGPDDGGGGACLEGVKEGVLLDDAWRLAWSRRAPYSWMDSLDGRWYSTVILEWRVEDGRCLIALGVDIVWSDVEKKEQG